VNKFVTTITIVHEAESINVAAHDAQNTMVARIKQVLVDAHNEGAIGAVRNVSRLSTRDKVML